MSVPALEAFRDNQSIQNLYDRLPVAQRELKSTPRNWYLPGKMIQIDEPAVNSMTRFSSCAYQDFHGRWLDGDVDGIEVCRFDVPHALHVDVQYTDEVLRLDVLHGSFTRPVHVPGKHGVLDELPVVDPCLHRLPRDVMVIWNTGSGIYRLQIKKAKILLTQNTWCNVAALEKKEGMCRTFAVLFSGSRISCCIWGLRRHSCQSTIYLRSWNSRWTHLLIYR